MSPQRLNVLLLYHHLILQKAQILVLHDRFHFSIFNKKIEVNFVCCVLYISNNQIGSGCSSRCSLNYRIILRQVKVNSKKLLSKEAYKTKTIPLLLLRSGVFVSYCQRGSKGILIFCLLAFQRDLIASLYTAPQTKLVNESFDKVCVSQVAVELILLENCTPREYDYEIMRQMLDGR